MDFLPELLKQGALGLVAGIFLWLFLQEKSERKQLQKDKDVLMEARRLDATEFNKMLNSMLPNITNALQAISDKIEATKRQG